MTVLHPVPLYAVLPVVEGGGQLVLSAHPASYGTENLATVLADYRRQGVELVVTLVAEDELDALGLINLEAECQAQGLLWAFCPIPDFGVPGQDFEISWQELAPRLLALLSAGRGVAIHCRAGLGRTGTVAARILIERGMAAEDAIATVRRCRPGSIETLSQEAYLLRLSVNPGSCDECRKSSPN
jgi:protein-tyrosine phosphatase